MLVHKKTHGVLEKVWNAGGTALITATFSSCRIYGIDPAEWWSVDAGTALARRIRLSYPDFEPIVNPDDGTLVDILNLRASVRASNKREQEERDKEQMKKAALSRGYTRVYKRAIEPDTFAFLGPSLRRRKGK